MPVSVTVYGSFARGQTPVQGLVRFTPERLWVICDDIPWASLAPEVQLDANGRFEVDLTATDNDSVPWYYQVESPAGLFRIRVFKQCSCYGLKELIVEHRSGQRPTH
jgi:hypothetical protein